MDTRGEDFSGDLPDAVAAPGWCPGGVNALLSRALDAAFGHPCGLVGRLGGVIMARSNSEQERWAVRLRDRRFTSPAIELVARRP